LLGAGGCYVEVIRRPEGGTNTLELWQNTWGLTAGESRGVIVSRGPALDRLAPPETVIEGTIIADVFDPKAPGTLAPGRGFTRTAMTHHADLGYVLLACACPDYLPGSVNLLPVLLVSKAGKAGDWAYLGALPGEPADELAKRGRIWCDGGSLVRLEGGRWRIYLNGYGTVLAALEASDLKGPWRFVRDPDGTIRELLPEFPKGPSAGGCFPTVLRTAPDSWHAWITDTWPPQAIWHFRSKDGLAWSLAGDQPEITRAAVGQRPIKCLRTYVDPERNEIVGLLSVWMARADAGRKGWILHELRRPVE
jgi:hypothetical protein